VKIPAWFAALPVAALAVALVAAIGSLPPETRPQRTSGDDALSVAFGDAKATIGRALLQKADSYFHGGVDMDGHHDCLHTEHHDHAGHDGTPSHDAGTECRHTDFDPWKWINAHIRAPQVERHLEGEKAVELIPWLWAAVRANPHDTDAWTTAWYVAARQMKNDGLALKIAQEAVRLNPEALDTACILGRSYRAEKTRDPVLSRRAFQKARALGLKKRPLAPQDAYSFLEALDYLGTMCETAAEIRTLLAEARAVEPAHPVTESLAKRLKALR